MYTRIHVFKFPNKVGRDSFRFFCINYTDKLFKEGDVVQVGAVFAVIESDQNVGTEIVEEEEELSEMEIESEILKPLEKEEISEIKLESTSERFYSPLVKSIAKKESISQDELDKISGSGANGRVNKKEMLSYLENKSTKTQQKSNP